MAAPDPKDKSSNERGYGIAIGISLGVVFGLAMDQLAIGIALGVVLGIAVDSGLFSDLRS